MGRRASSRLLSLRGHTIEVGFASEQLGGRVQGPVVLLIVVDCILLLDLLLQFVLMYPAVLMARLMILGSKTRNFRHYLRTWFVPDVSLHAWAFDIVAIEQEQGRKSHLGSLQAVRMVRACLSQAGTDAHSNLHPGLATRPLGPRLHREPLYQRNDAVAVPTGTLYSLASVCFVPT